MAAPAHYGRAVRVTVGLALLLTGLALALPAAAQAPPARVTADGVGDVRLGSTFRALRRQGLVGRLQPGCELSSPRPRIAMLRAPLRGSVTFTARRPHRATDITVTGGAAARGVGIGDRPRAIRRAFPRVRFDHSTDTTFGITLARVPGRRGRDRLQFAVDVETRRVNTIAVPAISFCE